MWESVGITNEPSNHKEFSDKLDKISEDVETWPPWKQNALGKPPMSKTDEQEVKWRVVNFELQAGNYAILANANDNSTLLFVTRPKQKEIRLLYQIAREHNTMVKVREYLDNVITHCALTNQSSNKAQVLLDELEETK